MTCIAPFDPSTAALAWVGLNIVVGFFGTARAKTLGERQEIQARRATLDPDSLSSLRSDTCTGCALPKGGGLLQPETQRPALGTGGVPVR